MTAANDFWDDFATSGDYVTFANVGDTVSGTITAVRRHMFEDGKVVPQIELDTADGPKTMTAGQIRLKTILSEKRPRVGDVLTVTLTEIEKRPGGKTMKMFNVVIGPVTAAPVAAPAAPAAPTPAAPAADPLAGISPEAIAAIKGLL